FGGGTANVSVSQDGTNWVSLGSVNFDMPENYYLNAGPYDEDAPADPQVADFSEPYAGSVNAFAGEDNTQVISTLDGSAGGTWLDLSSTGLSQVNFIQFSVPDDAASGSYLALSAVSVAEGHEVPEPASLGLILAGGLILLGRRNRGA
ncbi:MAG TPA: PEP-CTERM sorting domain-containing protein, partial [Tepidisphaeraceae bacterium]|nr:PEP-CTERM sorting domain-containing protein [Tepidisphaeraceae bacterium]